MPTNLPSSFASAAAGQNATRGGRGGASSDWSRRDGRSANGTLTLRRSSTTPLSQTSQNPPTTDSAQQSPSIDPQPAHPSTYELSPSRYNKEELLAMAQPPRSGADVSRLFNPGWNPGHVNGGGSRAWGKSNENHIPQEPGACWNEVGDSTPLATQPMSLEERDAFTSDINSPVKPPTMNKDGAGTAGINGRKASLSQGAANAFGVSSPSSATRPGTRRRETSDANPFSLASPTSATRSGREDVPWLARRNTEREPEQHEDDTSSKAPGPIGNLMRSNTAGSSNMASLWGNSQPTSPFGGGFGNFAMGSNAADKKAAPGPSRLAHLIPKDNENPSNRSDAQGALNQTSWRSRPRTDTDPFGEDVPSGSAALGGSTETDYVPQQGNAGTLGTPVKGSAGDFGMSGLHLGDNGQGSPSETNPYRSPAADLPHEDEGGAPRQYSGFPQDVPSGYNTLQRAFTEGHDRSQTSSANRGFPMGHMSAWQAPGGPTAGTPDRERSGMGAGPFSPALFNSTDNIQSPSLGNLSSFFGPGPAAGGMGTNSIGRGSKLSSMFPAAMQAQMQQSQAEHDSLPDAANDPRFPSQLGAIGRNNFPTRETQSPMRGGRHPFFEDMYSNNNQAQYGSGQGSFGAPGTFTPVSGSGSMPFDANKTASTADVSSQQRIMVMPDRMRWVYLDPQQQVQGPFTGLEMNDWYKATFFTPDLRVKKLEDAEFEPLGQLIRRIGNSREPFLVPQVGVAHGSPLPSADTASTNNAGQVVPPLSSVFPAFGRTLTADEQNNLERRKQEEQYNQAQQRDMMYRHQAVGRFPGQPGLNHHSSAQSLQSQPSYGNMTSPIGGMPGHMPQGQFSGMPPSGANAGSFFDAVGEGRANLTQGADMPLSGDELAHLSQHERSVLAALNEQHGQQQADAAGEEMNFRTGLPEVDDLGPDAEGFKERLQEFNDLRAQHDAQQAAHAEEQSEDMQTSEEPAPRQSGPARISKSKKSKKMIPLVQEGENLSLTQQVQQTQAAAAAAQTAVEPDMPMPFPPPSSSTPLPAPTAQRVRSNLPDQYNRSHSGTPEDDAGPAEPPPTAPWAKEASNEAPRGPSLKEIQEAEARKAAQAEEAASAVRKAALEHEAALLREKEKQVAAAAAGLPASSTWGHSASPVAGGSPWIKPAAAKAPAPGAGQTTASSKKTLAEIQAEEERRKQKARDVSVQSAAPAPSSKSYANLAGKTGQAIPSGPSAAAAAPPGAGWATVGAGGKVKAPLGSGSVPRSASATQPKPSPAPLKPTSRPGPASQVTTSNTALDDFRKWVTRELARGGLNIPDYESFGQSLEALPLDTSLIADAIYANSTIMDGRHFAEEYVRRKKLADKGISEKGPAATEVKVSSSGGGWSEVAKKTAGTPTNAGAVGAGSKEEAMPGFKVVSGKKKGKK